MKEVNMTQLAHAMLQWGDVRERLDEIEAEIIEIVLALEKTQQVGYVRATYSGGRKTYSYAAAGRSVPSEIVAKHTKPRIDWKSVCEEAKITDVPYVQSDPHVSIKSML